MKLDTETPLGNIRYNLTLEERREHAQALVESLQNLLTDVVEDLKNDEVLDTLYGQNRLCVIEAVHDKFRQLKNRPLGDPHSLGHCPCCK